MNIVVCEDHSAIQDLIEWALDDLGYNVIKSQDELSLLDALKKNKTDLIILDYWLNNVTAEHAVKVIKQDKVYKSIPIILISAVNNIKELKEKLNLNDYLRKPFDIDELISKVKIQLNDSKNSSS